MVQALAHESGHNLLFGLCADGPLHENDNDERFTSPLRRDPRPMDGIIHAAYVSARQHQSVQRLLDARVLDDAQQRQARAANVANAKHFAMGIDTVDRHAKLTPLGQSAMDNARRYMAAYL
jgi:HEXXH motif-containing protein